MIVFAQGCRSIVERLLILVKVIVMAILGRTAFVFPAALMVRLLLAWAAGACALLLIAYGSHLNCPDMSEVWLSVITSDLKRVASTMRDHSKR
jgi:hypothetical protein